MLDTVQELPAAAGKIQTTNWAWKVMRTIGSRGRPFTVQEVKARVPDEAKRNLTAYVKDLASAGFLENCAPDTYKLARTKPAADLTPCPQPVAFHNAKLNLQIPRNHDGIWSLMRWFAQHQGYFTLDELRRQIGGNIADEDLTAYVRALDRGGFITPELTIGFDPRYRVNLKFVETPRVRADGSLMTGPQRFGNMWRSMKMCGYFTAVDLAIAASLPDLPISREQAARYADDLVAGGYLVARDRGNEPRLYRLRPNMNTGPAAPVILRARFVWDANLCRIMGQASSVDEVRA